jgi:hypothetical protein
MSDDGTVNSQITDSVTQSSTFLIGQGAASSMGMLDMVLLETLGMAMHNAVVRQQHNQMSNSAAITAACAKMLQAPFPIKPPPPSPSPPPPGGLPGPGDPASDIAKNFADAQTAIAALKRDQASSASNASNASKDLDALAKLSTATDPSTPSSPSTPSTPSTPSNP